MAYLKHFIVIAIMTLMMILAQKSTAIESSCGPITKVIYVRGSGQPLGAWTYSGLKEAVDTLNDDSMSIEELHNDIQGGGNANYPAVAVSKEGFVNGVIATMTAGSIGKYKKSVDGGVELLSNYSVSVGKSSNCLVLVGYSQGAHVVGQALSSGALDEIKNKIVYVGLLGDPKLDLHGYGLFAGTDLPWYRGNAVPILQGGILGGRRPDYLPRINDTKQMFTDGGSWCYDDDPICTSNVVGGAIDGGHGRYVQRAIPQLVQEIANAVAKVKQTKISKPECGALKQDIVLALNVSPSMMADDMFWSTNGRQKLYDGLTKSACDVRIGVVAFGREGKEPTRPVLPLTENTASFGQAISSLRSDNRDYKIEKVDIDGALNVAMDMNWRDDAQKAVVVVSDAPGDNYVESWWGGVDQDKFAAVTANQEVIRSSRAHDGVEVHATRMYHQNSLPFVYTPGSVAFYDYMRPFVATTSGSYSVRNNCDACSWMDMRFDLKDVLKDKPLVSVQNVRIKVGESISLDAKDISAGVIDEWNKLPNYPVSYNWSLNCDNRFETTHAGRNITFSPTKTGTCQAAVSVRGNSSAYCNICYESDPYGVRTTTSFTIEVIPANYTPPPTPGAVRNLVKERLWNEDVIRISWDPPANAADVGDIAYVIKDSDGSILGVTRSTKLHITDVLDDKDPIVTISVGGNGSVGPVTSTLAAEDVSGPRPLQAVTAADTTTVATPRQGTPVRAVSDAQMMITGETLGAANQQSAAADASTFTKPLSSAIIPQSLDSKSKKPWLSLAIIAISIAVALVLGLTVKYGLMLRHR